MYNGSVIFEHQTALYTVQATCVSQLLDSTISNEYTQKVLFDNYLIYSFFHLVAYLNIIDMFFFLKF